MSLLTMIILVLVMLGISTLRSSEKAARIGPATQVAEALLSEVLYDVENDDPPGTKASFWASTAGVPWRSAVPITVGGVKYEYTLYADLVTDVGGVPVGTLAGEPGNRVMKADLVLTWWDSGSSGGVRKGYGKLETTASRIVNER
ncbi:MAG: hypothetical protein AB1758_26890 [Candidatus Eremiobacterota bacterium]